MCHHYELREWEALRESIEDAEDELDEEDEKKSAAPVADD